MFCGKCGAKNEDGAGFCQSCGAPLVGDEEMTVTQEMSEDVVVQQNTQYLPQKEKSTILTKRVIGAMITLGVLLVVLGIELVMTYGV